MFLRLLIKQVAQIFNLFFNALLIFFILPAYLFADCTDIGSDLTCHAPVTCSTWRNYNEGGQLYQAACGASEGCTCGVTDAGGPCDGCGFQSFRSDGNCFTDNTCATPCSLVPELGNSNWHPLIFACATLIFISLACFKLRKTS